MVRCGAVVLWMLLALEAVAAPPLRIGVLSLFRPQQVLLSAPDGAVAVLHTETDRIVLDPSIGQGSARVSRIDGGLLLEAGNIAVSAREVRATGRDGAAIEFLLAVPEKICRKYIGTLDVKSSSGVLQLI